VGIAQGTLARFILYGRKASFGQFFTECRLETAATP
jgi:hypothetical protein